MDATAGHVWRSTGNLAVLASGTCLPHKWANPEFLAIVEERCSAPLRRRAERILSLLRIQSRHLSRPLGAMQATALPGCSNSELAAAALHRALNEAGLEPNDLGYILGHTTTPDTLLPPNIAHVAEHLDYRGPFAEFRQACVGFGSALAFAFGLLQSPKARPIAIVGSETGSLGFDPSRAAEDHGQLVNMVQMGDGAAALILGPERAANGAGTIFDAYTGQIGTNLHPGFHLKITPTGHMEFEHDFMRVREQGLALFDAGIRAAQATALPPDAADLIIPHQANGVIDKVLAERYGWPQERIFVNAVRLGNTGSAAILLAFDEARRGLTPGATICLLGAEATKYMFAGFAFRASSR